MKPSPGPRAAERDVEPVRLGHRVEVEDHPVAAGEARRGDGAGVEADLGAAVGDLDPAVERRAGAAARSPPGRSAAGRYGDGRCRRRCRAAAARWDRRAAARQPAQPRLGDVELADVDMAAQIGERPVVEIGLGRAEEGARAGRRARDRPAAARLNTEPSIRPTWTLRPGHGLERVDLADDEAPARIGVEPEQEGGDQQRRRDRRAAIWRPSRGRMRRRSRRARPAIRRPARSRRRR